MHHEQTDRIQHCDYHDCTADWNISLLASVPVGQSIYSRALPGGYGYNVLPDDPDDTAFLVDGWEYYPGELLDPEDFTGDISPEFYTYIGEYPNFSAHLGSPYGAVTYRLILKNEGQPVEISSLSAGTAVRGQSLHRRPARRQSGRNIPLFAERNRQSLQFYGRRRYRDHRAVRQLHSLLFRHVLSSCDRNSGSCLPDDRALV